MDDSKLGERILNVLDNLDSSELGARLGNALDILDDLDLELEYLLGGNDGMEHGGRLGY